jgi:hypothetical protein
MVTPNMYHEKQVREMCGIHALNNLFQGKITFVLNYSVLTLELELELFQLLII